MCRTSGNNFYHDISDRLQTSYLLPELISTQPCTARRTNVFVTKQINHFEFSKWNFQSIFIESIECGRPIQERQTYTNILRCSKLAATKRNNWKAEKERTKNKNKRNVWNDTRDLIEISGLENCLFKSEWIVSAESKRKMSNIWRQFELSRTDAVAQFIIAHNERIECAKNSRQHAQTQSTLLRTDIHTALRASHATLR